MDVKSFVDLKDGINTAIENERYAEVVQSVRNALSGSAPAQSSSRKRSAGANAPSASQLAILLLDGAYACFEMEMYKHCAAECLKIIRWLVRHQVQQQGGVKQAATTTSHQEPEEDGLPVLKPGDPALSFLARAFILHGRSLRALGRFHRAHASFALAQGRVAQAQASLAEAVPVSADSLDQLSDTELIAAAQLIRQWTDGDLNATAARWQAKVVRDISASSADAPSLVDLLASDPAVAPAVRIRLVAAGRRGLVSVQSDGEMKTSMPLQGSQGSRQSPDGGDVVGAAAAGQQRNSTGASTPDNDNNSTRGGANSPDHDHGRSSAPSPAKAGKSPKPAKDKGAASGGGRGAPGSTDNATSEPASSKSSAKRQAKKRGKNAAVAAAAVPAARATPTSTNSFATSNRSAAADRSSPAGVVAQSAKAMKTGRLEFGSGNQDTDKMIALGFLHVNTGQYAKGIELFSQLLSKNPRLIGAFLGRGTARALCSDLKGAVADFSSAIDLDAKCADAWKRRGQSRAALAASLAQSARLSDPAALMGGSSAAAAAASASATAELNGAAKGGRGPNAVGSSLIGNGGASSDGSGATNSSSSSSNGSGLGRGSVSSLAGASDLTRRTFAAAAQMAALALKDLNTAVSIDPADSEALFQRGLMQLRARRFHAAMVDLEGAVSRSAGGRDTAVSLNHLGLVLNTVGRPADAIDRHKRALKLEPTLKEAWTNLAQAHRELGDQAAADRCFTRAIELDSQYREAYQLRGRTRFSGGDYRGAMADFGWAIKYAPTHPGSRHMRGVVYHGLGMLRNALAEYNAVLKKDPGHMAFYMRERVLWLHARLDTPIDRVNADATLPPVFKEGWCKGTDPRLLRLVAAAAPANTDAALTADGSSGAGNRTTGSLVYTAQPGLQGAVADVKLSRKPKSYEHGRLVLLARRLGARLQYHCPGFLVNVRQHRSFGFAIVEIAQRCAAVWEAAAALLERGQSPADWPAVPAETAGDFVNGLCSSAPDCGAHRFGWRDLFDLSVKWRQHSEVNDPVWWVDRLTPEQFAEGFGSHTPMVTEHTHVVRYYPNFPRAFALVRQLVIDHGARGLTANELAAVKNATDYKQMHAAMGRDFWVVTPCESRARPGVTMEGTRITIQRLVPSPAASAAAIVAMGSGDIASVPAGASGGYEVSIRTPGTPSRWALFEREMEFHFNQFRLAAAASDENETAGERRVKLARLALTLVFYWYNFMPLSRGTAACGFVVLLGLLHSVGITVTGDLPTGMQIDWEAILTPTPESFHAAVGDQWLFNVLADLEPDRDPRIAFPLVGKHCSTLRHLIETLNVELADEQELELKFPGAES